jgi:hypothetical protein
MAVPARVEYQVVDGFGYEPEPGSALIACAVKPVELFLREWVVFVVLRFREMAHWHVREGGNAFAVRGRTACGDCGVDQESKVSLNQTLHVLPL